MWLQAIEKTLSYMINICETSAQSIHLQAYTDLKTFTEMATFMPKQIASLNGKPAAQAQLKKWEKMDPMLERKHMAYLLK